MQKLGVALALLAAASATLLSAPSAQAQQAMELPAPSPAAKVAQRVGLTDISLDYSSPAVKGRTVWGDLVPWDKVWRAGANAATKITFSRDAQFGGQPVKAGTYALVALPTQKGWTLILNSDLGVFGGGKTYDQKADVVRVAAKTEAIAPRERMIFTFANTTDDSTRLDLEWEKLRISVDIKVDTAAQAKANIEAMAKGAWRPYANAARYLSETAGDHAGALALADKSLALEVAWYNTWIKAQILQRSGKEGDALELAKKAYELGQKDPNFFYKEAVEKALKDWKKK
ncbi:MAG: DUF2911 domain-containing protein, partial [Deltaproteobacteria bacterium]|nr:DUF2911 domain-containing protein [Deltaproteobacteria bacterium]